MMYRCNVMLLNRTLYTKWDVLCSFEAVICHSWTVKVPWGRNNSKIPGSQQDYLVGKSGSLQIYLVVIWPRFK